MKKSCLLKEGRFAEAFELIRSKGMEISLDNILGLFGEADAFRVYVFIGYVIEREPSSKAHLAAAACLLFGGMGVDCDYLLAKKHLLAALKEDPEDEAVYEFIFAHFADCPDNTFSAEETEAITEAYDKLRSKKADRRLFMTGSDETV